MASFGARRWFLFFVLVLVTLSHSLWTVVVFPPRSGPDEQDHIEYAHFLEHERRLPDPRTEDVGQIQHPPLPYVIFAAALHFLQELDRRLGPDVFSSRDWTRVGLWKTTFEPGRRLSADLGVPANTDNVRFNDLLESRRLVLYGMRLVPVILGILSLFFLLGCTRRLWPNHPDLALLTVLAAATLPQYPFHFATISNDSFMTFFGLWMGYALLKAESEGRLFTPRVIVGLSLIAAGGFLVKLHFIGITLFAGLFVLTRPVPLALRIKAVCGLAAGPVLLASWWHIRQIMLQGSLLSVKSHAEFEPYLLRLSPWHPMAILQFADGTLRSFLGVLGQDLVSAFPVYYFPAAGLAAAALFGVLFLRDRGLQVENETRPAATCLMPALLATALLLLLLNISNILYHHGHGRYLMAVLLPLIIILGEGTRRVAGSRATALLAAAVGWNLIFLLTTYFLTIPSVYGIRLEKIDRGQVVRYVDAGHPTPSFDDGAPGRSTINFPYPELFKPEFTTRFAYQNATGQALSYETPIPDVLKRYQVRVAYPDPAGRAGSELPSPSALNLLADSWLIHGPLSYWHSFGRLYWPLPETVTEDGSVKLWWQNGASPILAVSELWIEEAWVSLAELPLLVDEPARRRVVVQLRNNDHDVPHMASIFLLQDGVMIADRRNMFINPRETREIEFPLASDQPFEKSRLRVKVLDHDTSPFINMKLATCMTGPAVRGGDPRVPDIDVLRFNTTSEADRVVAHFPIERLFPGHYLLGITHSAETRPLHEGHLLVEAEGAALTLNTFTKPAPYGRKISESSYSLVKDTSGETPVTLKFKAGHQTPGVKVEVDRLFLRREVHPDSLGHTWPVR